MKKIKFKYRDEISNWEWREQECVVSSVEECKNEIITNEGYLKDLLHTWEIYKLNENYGQEERQYELIYYYA